MNRMAALLQGLSTGGEAKAKRGGEKYLLGQVCSKGKTIHIQGLPQKGQDDGFNQQICQKNTLRDTEKVIKTQTGVHRRRGQSLPDNNKEIYSFLCVLLNNSVDFFKCISLTSSCRKCVC